jgi:hypothetical protein
VPKRTNAFQQLIVFIYQHVKAAGGSVSESALVFDRSAEINREVDILIESEVAGHKIKIAVECRGREKKEEDKKKHTVQWVDELIGKYVSIDIDKVVAVSERGFSAPARKKALAHNIDLLSFEEAKDIDWGKHFQRPRMAFLSDPTLFLANMRIVGMDDFQNLSEIDPDIYIEAANQHKTPIREFCRDFFSSHVFHIAGNFIQNNMHNLYKSYNDTKNTLLLELPIHLDNATIKRQDKILISNPTLIFITACTWKVADFNYDEKLFDKDLITSANHTDHHGTTYRFDIVQEPSSKHVHIRFGKSPDVQ